MQAVRAADTNEVVKLIFRGQTRPEGEHGGAACALGEGAPALTRTPSRGPALERGPTCSHASAPSDLAWGGGPTLGGALCSDAPSVAPPWGAPCSWPPHPNR